MIAISPARVCALVNAAALTIAVASGAAHADVGLNKSFSPNSVAAGQVTTVVIDLLNPNASSATGVSLTDNLPANVVVANPLTIPTNTCGFAVAAVPGTGTIGLSGGTIGPITGGVPGSCRVSVNVVSTVPNTYLNLIPPAAVSSSQGSNTQSAQATLVVSALLPVTAGKAFAPNVVHGNGASQTSVSTLTITLTNPNAVPLTNAAITDTLPAAVTIATPSNAATTCGAGTATASLPATSPATIALSGGTIPASGNCTITVQVIARNPTTAQNSAVTNTVAAGALTTAQGITSPQFQANVTVQTGGAITKAFSPNPIAPGGTSTLTITISNFNQTTLSPITFTDTLAGTQTIAGAAATTCGGVVTTGANSVTLTGGSLGPAPATAGATTCTVTVPVTATATANNNIAAGNFGGVNYSGTGNVALTVSSVSGSKAFTVPAIQGGTTQMTITLINNRAVPVTITSVTDNLATMGAGFFSVQPGATVSGTCGSSLTSALPATLLTFTGGNIGASSSCTIIVNPVTIAATTTAGNHTDTIAVNGVVTSLGNNTTTLTGTVNITRVLAVAKAFAPTPVVAGARTRLTVTITRGATAPALSGLAFTDSLATMGGLGFVVANPANAATTCVGGTVTATPGANNFSLSGGTLAGGAAATTCTVAVDVQVPVGQAAGTYTNTLGDASVTSTQGFSSAGATANLVVNPMTNVTINKSFAPTTVAVGGASTMTIQIRNNNAGAFALTGVGLTDSLPTGMVVANPPAPSSSNCGAPTLTAVLGAGSVSVANATIAAGAICSVSFGVRANNSGNLINLLGPGAVTSAQGVTNPLIASATLASTGAINLNVTKVTNVTPLVPGGTTSYTVGISNAGPNAVSGLVVNDAPPPGITFTSWTCVGSGGATCGGPGSGAIADTASIPSGGAVTYTINAAIDQFATGNVINQVCVVVPGSVINSGNTCASRTDPLVPSSTLAISKTGPPSVAAGGGLTYSVVVTNTGPSAASGTLVTDPAVANFTVTGVTCPTSSGGATCPATLTVPLLQGAGLNIATFPVGGSVTLSVTGTAGASGSIVNTATATPPAGPPVSSPATTTINSTSNLTISKTGAATVTAGASLTYTVVVTNPGPSAANGTLVTDPAVANFTVTGVTCPTSSGGATCPATLTVPLLQGAGLNIATFPVGGSVTLSVTGTAGASGSIVNTATATPPAGPPVSSPATTTINPTSNLTISKTGAATVTAGASLTYTVVVTNPGPSAASGTLVTDPAVANFTVTGVTCPTSSGGATCPAALTVPLLQGAGLNIATFPVGGSVTLSVTGTAGASGSIVNTATATPPAGPPVSSPATTTINPTSNLTISKTGAATVTAGASLTYTVVVTNPGPSAANGTLVTDPAVANFTVTGVTCPTSSGGATCPATLTVPLLQGAGLNIATFPVGGSVTLSVTGTAGASGSIVNTATATPPAGPPVSSPATTTINPTSGLTISKTGAATVTAGASLTYTVVVTNPGPSAANGTLVTDPAVANFTVTGVTCPTSSGGATCPAALTVPLLQGAGLNIATFPVGGSVTLSVTGTAGASGSIVNTATATPPAGPPVSSPATTTINPTSNLTISKTGAATVTAGASLTYTVVVTNPGPSAASGTLVTDPAVANFTVTGVTCPTSSGGATCPATLTVPLLQGAGLNIATFPVGGSVTLSVTGTAGASGSIVNTATATPPAGPPVSSPATTTINPTSGLTIAKTGPASVTAGASLTYTVVVTNPGPSAANGTLVTDPAVANFTVTGVTCPTSSGGATCPAALTVPLLQGAGLNIATFPVGGSVTLSVTGTAGASGSIVNTATATPPAGPPVSSPATTTINPTSGLTIAKTGPASVTAGASLTYTVVVTNLGPSAADGTLVTDPAVANFTVTGVTCPTSSGGATCPATLTVPLLQGAGLNIATFPVGGSVTLSVTGTAGASGSIVNTATATPPAGPPVSSPATTTINPTSGLTIAKTGPATVTAGASLTYTVVVTNLGPSAADGTLVTDPAVANFTVTGVTCPTSSGGATCPATLTVPLLQGAGLNIATFPLGGTVTFNITGTAGGSGTIVNTATATPPAGAPVSSTAPTTTIVNAGVSLAKTIAPATIASGGTATLTLALGNGSASTFALTAPFVDAMPAGVTTTSGNSGTCTGVTVTPTSVTMASGTPLPPGGCTIVVTITSSTPGTVTNTTGALTTSGGTAPPASAPLTVSAGAASLTKTIAPGLIVPGGTATLTISLGNSGAVPLVLAAPFTDPMPAGLTTTSGNSGTCVGVTVTATLITLPAGTVLPPGGCTIVVSVTTSTPGTTTNVTSALSAGGYVVPAASAPIATSIAPTEIPVDSPLALLLTAMLIAIAGAGTIARRRTR